MLEPSELIFVCHLASFSSFFFSFLFGKKNKEQVYELVDDKMQLVEMSQDVASLLVERESDGERSEPTVFLLIPFFIFFFFFSSRIKSSRILWITVCIVRHLLGSLHQKEEERRKERDEEEDLRRKKKHEKRDTERGFFLVTSAR